MFVTPEVNVNELLELMMSSDLGQSEIVSQKCKDACKHLARAMEEVQKEADRRQNWPPTIQRIYDSVLEMTTDAFARFDTIDDLKATQKQKNYLSVRLIMFIEVSMTTLQIIDTNIELRMANIQAETELQENKGEKNEDHNRSPTTEMEEC
uniref:Uncharacterized protein n=1 Tax=Trichuris muris TaxID=70415 RepID=A0A5S6Q7F5_TRIMR